MPQPKSRALLVFLAAIAAHALALPSACAAEGALRVCVPDTPIPPYVGGSAGKLGQTELAITEAARTAGFAVELLYAPPARCIHLLERNDVEASLAAPTAPNLELARFPMKGGKVNSSLRLANARVVFVVRGDAALDWDGRQFTGASGAKVRVAARRQLSGVLEPLQQRRIDVSEQPTTVKQMLEMLSRKRVDVVASLEEELRYELRQRDSGLFRVLPVALVDVDYFLAVNAKTWALHRAAVERLWERAAEKAAHGAGSDRPAPPR